MRFSNRNGYSTRPKLAQIEYVSPELKIGLWNAMTVVVFETYTPPFYRGPGSGNYIAGSNFEVMARKIWAFYFKRNLEDMNPFWPSYLTMLRNYFLGSAEWYEIFDFVEYFSSVVSIDDSNALVSAWNICFEEDNSAYRIIDKMVVEITSQVEIDEVERSLEFSDGYSEVKVHLAQAVSLLSDRKQPDYRNSIKESISAVESLCIFVVGKKGTLGQLLKYVEGEKGLHPSLRTAFSSLYGYTSDADGIRHALQTQSVLSKSDARFMLVVCSAFINYVIHIYGA